MNRWCIAVLFASWPLCAQVDADASALIQKARHLAKDSSSYEMEIRSMIRVAGAVSNSTTVTTSVIWVKPDKMRVESKSAVGTITIVSDGQTTFLYMSSVNQYLKRAAAFSPEIAMQMTGTTPASVPASANWKSAKILGSENLIVEGTEIPCKVVMVEYDSQSDASGLKVAGGRMVLWIDPKSGVTLKQESAATVESQAQPKPTRTSIKTEVTKLRTDLSYPDSTFQFTPPSGAQEVQQLGMVAFGRTDVVGKPLPELNLKTLEGKPFEGSTFSGKTVLLTFWTTWCEPCRAEMPELEKAYQSLKAQGVEVFAVDLDEDAQTVSSAAKELGIHYPVLLGATEDTDALSVNVFPTHVVVDPSGMVTRYAVGQRTEEQFRELVGKAVSILPQKPTL